MFREMRRKKQALSEEEAVEVLNRGSSGVLALLGDDEYPYAVPVSYVYCDSRLYFHGAKSGHKVDALQKCNKASFCVIDKDDVVPEEYTTYFKSVIAFGKIRILEEEAEMRKAIEILSEKYYPDGAGEKQDGVIDGAWSRLCMMELSIEHLSGKEAIELVRR